MSRFSLAGLNIRLLLLVLLAMLPAFGLLLYNAAAERQQAAALVQDDTRRLARLTAAQAGQIVEGQRQLLVAIASLEPVAARDTAGCVQVLTRLIDQFPFYSGLGAAAPDGQVFCSTVPFTGSLNVAGRSWYQRAVASGGFALGDYQKGQITGRDVVVGAYPAYDDAGELRVVVSAALDLERLNQVLAAAQLPAGAAVNITDHAGTVLARYPDPALWVGRTLEAGPLLDRMLNEAQGTVELEGVDGVTRLYAFESWSLDNASALHVAVGIPAEVAFAGAEAALRRNLVLMGLAAVLALAVTRAVAEALVLRRASSLLKTTQRLAAGDLRARVGGPYGASELDGLARSFDQMAAALEVRQAELQQAVRSLEMLSACNQALVRADDEPSLLNEVCRAIVDVGGYRLAWIALPEAPADRPARLRVAAQAGDAPAADGSRYLEGLDLTLGDGGPQRLPAETALLTREAVTTVLRHADARGVPWLSRALARGYQAMMALPIAGDGQPLGALSLFAAEANAFGEADVRLLRELAEDVAFGLRALRTRAARAQAEAALRRHAERVDTLAEISRDLAAVTPDETRVLEVIARRVSSRLDSVCIIRLLSDDGQWLNPVAVYHSEPAIADDVRQVLGASPQPADQGAAKQVLGSGRALRIAAVTTEQARALAAPAVWPLIERLNLHSVIFTPLRTQTHTLGVLNVTRVGDSPAFSADDEAFAQELADRAALSLGNARLYRSLQQLNAELEARVAERTRALQRSAAEFQDLYDQAPCGYHSLSEDGTFVRINQYELRLLGYARDEIVGQKRFSDLLTPESRARFHENFPRFKATGRVSNLEFELVSRTGQVITVLLSATAVYDEAGRFDHSRSTLIDISDRKRAEAQIQALNQVLEERAWQLESANQELRAFSYSVSHDLRAPLRSIDGFSLALVEDYSDRLDEAARDYLSRIRAAAQRMGDLIDALLGLSRVTRAELRRAPLDLSGLAEAVAAELRQREPERPIEVQIAPGLRAEGDPSLVRNVLENLLGNAWKFTAGQAPARIEVGGLDGAADEHTFFVRDNGAGFDMTYAERLFGAFQRLHDQREFKGTGIGLATVQRIIIRHGGRVWAEGSPGLGATFYFTLP